MNLLMCCTPLGREERYLKELRFVIIAALFFKKIYPEAKIFVGTTQDAKIPNNLFNLLNIIRFPFEKYNFPLARQLFYKDFISSKNFSDDTIICGCDVIFFRKIDDIYNTSKIALTYRFHRSMPYCSDFFLATKENKDFIIKFQNNVIETIKWMPQEVQNAWSEQLSIAIEVGYLSDEKYNGEINYSPNYKKEIILFPGDDYLFTPNDFFSSVNNELNGQHRLDTPDLISLKGLSKKKVGIHFKGNRKNLFFALAYMCKLENYVDIDNIFLGMSDEFLFEEYFEIINNN